MKIRTFFLKIFIIFPLKLLVNQDNARIYILPIKWIENFLLLITIMSCEIKRDKWILLYFLILLHYIEFLFNNTLIYWSVTSILKILRVLNTLLIDILFLPLSLWDVVKVVEQIVLLAEKFVTFIIKQSFLWTHLQACLVERYAYFL